MVFKWSDHADPTIRILLLLVVVPWGCDFKGCDLKGCDLKGCDFKGCDFKGCDFKGCDVVILNAFLNGF